jgi:predicted rRNA pseudouridine synthase
MSGWIESFRWLMEDLDIVIKDDEEDYGFGVHPLERDIDSYISHGVINLDKPRGPTSHQVTAWVKHMLKVSKTGHGGTLDPMVSGVLPIGIERATPVMRYIVGSYKEYVGIIHLHGDVEESELESVLNLFKRGRIYQKPPYRSSVRRRLRTKEIYDFQVIERESRDLLFRVRCESGFYVRKLAHDIGLILGVGAHLNELRRVAAGPFNEDHNLVSLYDLAAGIYLLREEGDESYIRKVIMPYEYVFKNYPKIIVKDTAVASIAYGAQLKAPGILGISGRFKKDDRVALFTKRSEIIGVVIAKYTSEEVLKMDKGIVALTERILIERELYPPMWRKMGE